MSIFDVASAAGSAKTTGRRASLANTVPSHARHMGRPITEQSAEDFSSHLIGEDPVFRKTLQAIQRQAGYGVTVLIQGETGTGKELAARAIHYLGPDDRGPFVPVHCGAISDDLCENELFGHVKGAYTGAQATKPGILAAAEGGTLFLDEIECLSLRMQSILLRVLQDHAYRPLGSTSLIQGRFRVVAASNRNLAAMVRSGELREDLFHRLNVLGVTMPSLRQRISDIPLLARHFIGKFARQYGVPEKTLSETALRAMMRHSWPGNVRELENTVHRQFLLCECAVLYFNEASLQDNTDAPPSDLRNQPGSLPIPHGVGFRQAKETVIAEFERRYLTQLMSETAGNISRAARVSGKERSTLRRLLKKYAINASH